MAILRRTRNDFPSFKNTETCVNSNGNLEIHPEQSHEFSTGEKGRSKLNFTTRILAVLRKTTPHKDFRSCAILAWVSLFGLFFNMAILRHTEYGGGKVDYKLKLKLQQSLMKQWSEKAHRPHREILSPLRYNHMEKIERHRLASSNTEDILCVPKFLRQPTRGRSAKPPPYDNLERIASTDREMRMELRDINLRENFHSLYENYATIHKDDWDSKQLYFGVCVLYSLGGIFAMDHVSNLTINFLENFTQCHQPMAFVILDDGSDTIDSDLMIFTRHHPELSALIENVNNFLGIKNEIAVNVADFIRHFLAKYKSDPGWRFLSKRCTTCIDEEDVTCCKLYGDEKEHILFSYQKSKSSVPKGKDVLSGQSQKLTVTERTPIESRISKSKISLQQYTKKNYWCDRCLKDPRKGNMAKCVPPCSHTFQRLICNNPRRVNEVVVEVEVPKQYNTKQVPRIIHQTWFEHVHDPSRYPDLSRLQNAWKIYRRNGWEYRFYTDDEARQYIIDHYPKRFVEAFDVLEHGAYRADLFRYLVLLLEGGLYVDIDVLPLAPPEEIFMHHSLTTVRDLTCGWYDQEFCLWNGLIAAAPGHPAIARAAEHTVNMVMQRADLFDIAREFCKSENTELWKIFAEPWLLMSGPCALGVAVNIAMGKTSNPMEKHNLGRIYNPHDPDYDALILHLNKNDMGMFVISDLDRNLMVASTSMQNMLQVPTIEKDMDLYSKAEQDALKKKEKPNYSNAVRIEFIWGSKMVYADNIVTNERIRLDLLIT